MKRLRFLLIAFALIAAIAATGCDREPNQATTPVVGGPFTVVGTIESIAETSVTIRNVETEQGSEDVQKWLRHEAPVELFANAKDTSQISDEDQALLSTLQPGQRVRITGEIVVIWADGAHGGGVSLAEFTTIDPA